MAWVISASITQSWLDINAEPRNHKPTFHTQRKSLLKLFIIHSHNSLHNLYLVVSAVFIVVFRLSRYRASCWNIKTWKVTSLSHTVYTSPPEINVMPTSSFSTFKMPARRVPTGHQRLTWERVTSGYLDSSLQENSRDIFLIISIVIANILQHNSFSARTIFSFYKDFFQFWPKTVYFNKFLNHKYNKILLYYWLSFEWLNKIGRPRINSAISGLHFVNTSPR